MLGKRLLVVLFIAATFVVQPGAASAQVLEVIPRQVELQFVSHVAAGMSEPDAYVETENGMVRRISAEEAEEYLDAPVYTAASMVEHDPFGLTPELMEPHAKGMELGMTMGEYLSATGGGTYTVVGDQAELDLSFAGLVPEGVYTLWCSTISTPPNFHVVNIPCGSPYGGENEVVADSDGNLDVHLTTTPLTAAREGLLPALALAYHSDGKTYDEYPGPFGLYTHVQLFTPIPAADDAAWQPIAPRQVELQFVSHVAAGMAEPDAYVETENGMVRRISAEEAEEYVDAPVYTAATMVEHDPFGLTPELMEPRAKGMELGMTMGEYLSATGGGTYTVVGDQAKLDLSFAGLVPEGVYTLWCSTISTPPNFHVVNIPCGSPYGGENEVVADSVGNLDVHLITTPLTAAREGLLPALALAYHSDGKTYDEYPGPFGLYTHVQLFTPIPAADDAAWQPIAPRQVELQFVSHVAAGMAEPDAYVETEDGMVRRISAEEAEEYLDAPVYTAASMVEHDPFGLTPELMEPHAKGMELGMTMGEYLSATGGGTYTVVGDQAELDLSFAGLVPEGVYTLWCSTISTPPNFHVVNIPCGSPYGGENEVVADSAGNLDVHLTTTPLTAAREGLLPALALAYHSDGKTYDEYPGPFGLYTHVQLFTPIPAADDAAWTTKLASQ